MEFSIIFFIFLNPSLKEIKLNFALSERRILSSKQNKFSFNINKTGKYRGKGNFQRTKLRQRNNTCVQVKSFYETSLFFNRKLVTNIHVMLTQSYECLHKVINVFALTWTVSWSTEMTDWNIDFPPKKTRRIHWAIPILPFESSKSVLGTQNSPTKF